MKIKLERKHKQDQESRSLRQLEAARAANLEKLVGTIHNQKLFLKDLLNLVGRFIWLIQIQNNKITLTAYVSITSSSSEQCNCRPSWRLHFESLM